MTSMDVKDECVLLIESDPGSASLIRAALADARDGPFAVEWAENLQAGIERLSKGGIKAILLNLFLSDSQGFKTFSKLYVIESQVPILILSDLDHEDIAKLAMQSGAQDYLLSAHLNAYSLSRAIRNVIERKMADDALFLEKERAQVTLNSIGDAVISTDVAGIVTYLNAAAERMTGWAQAAAKGRPFPEVFHIVDGITRKPLPNPMELAVQQNKTVGLALDSVLIRRDGVEVPIEDSAAPIRDRGGHVSGAVIVFHDVSAARSMMLKMSHLAQHDSLTNLPNRLLLNDRLAQAISMAHRRRKQLAVMFIDLDRFKNINDSLGHLIGDKLLQSVAQRLTACIRDSDTVSRQGGDEFVVLLADINDAQAAGNSAAKILAALADKHIIDKHELNVTLSIGISVFPGDGDDAETLLKNADAAMYHAKENGRNNYQFFKQEMNDRAVERQSLESSLRQAMVRREFVLYYQPKVNLATGMVTGAQALIRWLHPLRGLLYPEQFMAIAEDSGLIVPIGHWLLREACLQAQSWVNAGFQPISVSINTSAAEFRRESFLADIQEVLKETGLDPRHLEIAMTENVLIQDVKSTLAVLKELKIMGVQLAINNFGTGYSSLNYLRQFPIDTLKIDHSFVRNITTHSIEATIVSAVIGMGNSLNIRVCADGIETQEQLAFLQAAHCAEGQGLYFSPAVDAEAFSRLRGATNRKYAINR